MLKKQDLGINPYVANNGSRDQSLTGIGGPRVTLVNILQGLSGLWDNVNVNNFIDIQFSKTL